MSAPTYFSLFADFLSFWLLGFLIFFPWSVLPSSSAYVLNATSCDERQEVSLRALAERPLSYSRHNLCKLQLATTTPLPHKTKQQANK